MHSIIDFDTFLYANVLYKLRRSLWAYLGNFAVMVSGIWSVFGDFNAFLGAREKSSLLPCSISCKQFSTTIDGAKLQALDTSDDFYMWAIRGARSFVKCKLDRIAAWIFAMLSLVQLYLVINHNIVCCFFLFPWI